MDPAPGTVTDEECQIEALLGRDGMGAVDRATRLALDRSVAVELLRPERVARPGSLKRSRREAFALCVDHPEVH